MDRPVALDDGRRYGRAPRAISPLAPVAGLLALALLGAGCRRPTPAPIAAGSTGTPTASAERAATALGLGSAGPGAAPSAPAPSAAPSARWPEEAARVPASDRGIYEDLRDRVRLRHPSWLAEGPAVVVAFGGQRYAAIGGVPVAVATGTEGPTVAVTGFAAMDTDGDGVPDPVDLLIGAKKVALNGAAYKNTYRTLPYPGGDLPRDEGVCTDVVVRALRNAGFDLQALVQDDLRAFPRRYPMVKRPDKNIDHRRVRTILPYFLAHFRSLSPDVRGGGEPLLPGDIVFLDTLPTPGPDHLGIVSDRVGELGLPLLVNNWTDGYHTAEMDLLGWVPVTHRFRVPFGPLRAAGAGGGLAGVLERSGLTVGPEHRQVVLVTASTWSSSAGELRRYTRQADGWQPVGEPLPVRLGASGLGRGRGLHGDALARLVVKREGDLRAPAGVFALGTAFGPGAAPYAGRWPWRGVGDRDRFVDDPRSPFYNTWQLEPTTGAAAWQSAEQLSRYSLGLVVEHNTSDVQPGAGSAIFLHPWANAATPTVGCTSMDRAALVALLTWLEPDARPVLVQLAGAVF